VLAGRCGVPAAFALHARGIRRHHRPHRALPYLRRCTSAPVDCRHPRRSRRDSSMRAATAAPAQARSPGACTSTAHRGGAAMRAAMLPRVAARVSRSCTTSSPVCLPGRSSRRARGIGSPTFTGSSQRRSTPGDSPSAPASEHGDQLAGRPIFGASTHAWLRCRPQRREQQ
jgi:hypothetical protein